MPPRTLKDTTAVSFTDLLNHIQKTPAPFASAWRPKLLLSLTSIANMWMYVVPSIKAGEREQGEMGKWLQLAGNTSCAALVVFNIGGHYIGLLEASRDAIQFLKSHSAIPINEPGTLTKLLNKLKKNQLHILFLAALTATPLAAAAWFYKDFANEPEALMGGKIGITFGVHTLIHTLPISLILNVDWLNFLLIKIPKYVITFPFIVGENIYRHCCTKTRYAKFDAAEQALQQKAALRAQVANELYMLSEKFKDMVFTKKGHCYAPDVTAYQGLTLEQLIDMISNPHETSALLPAEQHTSWLGTCGHYIYSEVRNLFGSAGSTLVGASIFGYLNVNYNLFYELLERSTFGALALLAGPAIVTEVLTMYYGWRAFTLAYDYLASCFSGKGQMPYAFKLNFGVSTLFLGITYFLNYFSYGTALQLTHDTCNPKTYGAIGCNLFEIASKWGIIVYGCINLAELVEKLVEPVARLCGSKNQKQFVEILNNLRRLAKLIDQLDPDCCQKLLNSIDNSNLLSALKLAKNAEDGAVHTSLPPTKKSSSWSSWCCWWHKADTAGLPVTNYEPTTP